MSLSPRAGEDQGPARTIGQEEWIPLPSPFCSTQAFTRQDTAHPHCGGSADSKAKLLRKHPETAFNQPSGPAVAWSNWPMKLDIILADKEPSCLVPRESDTSPSRDQWHYVAEPELWAWVRVHQTSDRIHARVLRGVRPGPKALRGQGDIAKKTKQKMSSSNHPSLVNTWEEKCMRWEKKMNPSASLSFLHKQDPRNYSSYNNPGTFPVSWVIAEATRK